MRSFNGVLSCLLASAGRRNRTTRRFNWPSRIYKSFLSFILPSLRGVKGAWAGGFRRLLLITFLLLFVWDTFYILNKKKRTNRLEIYATTINNSWLALNRSSEKKGSTSVCLLTFPTQQWRKRRKRGRFVSLKLRRKGKTPKKFSRGQCSKNNANAKVAFLKLSVVSCVCAYWQCVCVSMEGSLSLLLLLLLLWLWCSIFFFLLHLIHPRVGEMESVTRGDRKVRAELKGPRRRQSTSFLPFVVVLLNKRRGHPILANPKPPSISYTTTLREREREREKVGVGQQQQEKLRKRGRRRWRWETEKSHTWVALFFWCVWSSSSFSSFRISVSAVRSFPSEWSARSGFVHHRLWPSWEWTEAIF